MKVAIAFLCLVLVATAFAAPDKRFVLDDLKEEAAKILQCESTLDQQMCEACCGNTDWYHPSEKIACEKACGILP